MIGGSLSSKARVLQFGRIGWVEYDDVQSSKLGTAEAEAS
jgi:hypothetical protein